MFNESIKMAIDGMISNKLRTLLTLLGIIIGVGAVIAMVSLGFGVKEQVKNNISSLGSNLLIVMSGGRTASGARLAAGQGARLTAKKSPAIVTMNWRVRAMLKSALFSRTLICCRNCQHN